MRRLAGCKLLCGGSRGGGVRGSLSNCAGLVNAPQCLRPHLLAASAAALPACNLWGALDGPRTMVADGDTDRDHPQT